MRIINDLRKVDGLAISDRIRLWIGAGPVLAAALRAHGSWVSEEVLAVSLDVFDASATEPSRVVTANGSTHEIEMDGEPGVVIIAKT